MTAPTPEPLGPDEVLRFDPWVADLTYAGGGAEYEELLSALRSLTATTAASRPDASAMRRATQLITAAATELSPFAVPPGEGYSGRRYDLSGRGHPRLVAATNLRLRTFSATADVRFDASHIGGGGAIHGGMAPLLFDEVLGRLSNANRHLPARTAFLRTDYHQVMWPFTEYRLEASVDDEVGRKRYLSARLTGPDGLVASAEGLWVVLRDGAP